MLINEGILDDIEASDANISQLFPTNELKWPGDESLSVYITLEFSGSIFAEKLKELCDDLLMFLDLQRRIKDYSRMCASDSDYRLIRDIDDAIRQNKKYRNWGIDFGVSNHFRSAKDVVRFITRLNTFCGTKL